MTQKLDWTALGKYLRQNSLDAHGEVVDVRMAYDFLLCNSEVFLGEDMAWPSDMPQEPNIQLIAAYYGVGQAQAVQPVRPLLLDVADRLDDAGLDVTFQTASGISLTINGRGANVTQDVNGDIHLDWTGLNTSFFSMPNTSTVDALTTAILGWVSSQVLTWESKDILRNVLAAMEHADGMYGPDDYVTLMESIVFEANQRIVNYRTWHRE